MRGRFIVAVLALVVGTGAAAETGTGVTDVAPEDHFVARQGKAEVFGIDVDAHLAAMPQSDRMGYIDSPKRIQGLLSQLLLRRNLAIEARELGLDQDPVVQREIQQAAEVVLMRHRFAHIRATAVVPDLAQLAHEKYLANRDAFKSADKVTIAHVLLDTTKRSEEAAKALLSEWKAEVAAGTKTIEELADAHSDDPGVAQNHGVYLDQDPKGFVPEFAAAIAELKREGELIGPVKTEFGYHLIQLRQRTPGRALAWEDIKEQAVAAERDVYVRKLLADHVERLKTLPVEASEESVAPLRKRYGQPSFAVPVAVGADKEASTDLPESSSDMPVLPPEDAAAEAPVQR